jgi:hypothetical protein
VRDWKTRNRSPPDAAPLARVVAPLWHKGKPEFCSHGVKIDIVNHFKYFAAQREEAWHRIRERSICRPAGEGCRNEATETT